MKLEDLENMTVAQLNEELNNYAGTSVKKRKMPKDKLIAELADVMMEVGDLEVEEERRKKKRGPSTKEVLRSVFKNAKVALTMDELIEKCPTVKPNTIETAIVDLKNPKWAKGPVLKIARGDDNKYRIAQ